MALTLPIQISWLPWVMILSNVHSNAMAPSNTAPEGVLAHLIAPNRSGCSVSNRPANRSAKSQAPSGNTLTQNTWFCATAKPILLSDFRHTKTDGGSADKDENALTVAPVDPFFQIVVTIVTDCAIFRMASMNNVRLTIFCVLF